jgi:hypothetical protein
MGRTRDDFLNDCDADDREAYGKLFGEIDDLARSLGDPEPGDESGLGRPLEGLPLRLRIAFDDRKGASLKLQHPKLSGQAALLWFFPSRNVEARSAPNRVSAVLSPLPKVGVRAEDAAAFGADLERANFVSGGSKTLKTSTAGETGGIARIFRWESNRAEVVQAIRALVQRVGG